jgi:hypothetical protein
VVPFKPKTEVAGLAPRGSLAAERLKLCFPEAEKGTR